MRRLLAITLASPAAFGGVAFAMHATFAAETHPRLKLSVTPVRQSAVRGGAASFSVAVAGGRSPSVWPQVSMHNLPVNQDACRHAVLALHYSGQASQ